MTTIRAGQPLPNAEEVAPRDFRYAAFISYRNLPLDRKWAIQLLGALERYRAPWSLVRSGYPRKLGKVFRDDDELPAGKPLTGQLERALDDSSCLIVICSRNTPASDFIRDEIQHFQIAHGPGRILPFLVEGNEDEAFPDAMLFDAPVEMQDPDDQPAFGGNSHPIGADVRPRPDETANKTFQRALVRCAAAILGCGYDDLYQRELRRQRLRRTIVGSVLVLFAASAMWYWDQYVRIHEAYCINVSERYVIPQCVGELTALEVSRRPESFRLRTRAHAVLDLTRVNGVGAATDGAETVFDPVPVSDGAAQWLYSGDQEHRFSVVQLSRTGKRIRTVNVEIADDRSKAILRFDVGFGVGEWQPAGEGNLHNIWKLDSEHRTSIGQQLLDLDNHGAIFRRHYQPLGGGTTIPDEQGSYGQQYVRDGRGLPLSTRNLDALGNPRIERNGVASIRRQYDKRGALVNIQWLAGNGKPTMNSQFFAEWRGTRDALDRLVRGDTLDAKGQLQNKEGRPTIILSYDENGNATSEAYFDLNGHPAVSSEGISKVVWRHDSRGNKVTILTLGIDGKPVEDSTTGISKTESRFDNTGNKIESSFFDAQGEPTYRRDLNVARIKWTFDKRGNSISEAYYRIDGELFARSDLGFARTNTEFDSSGRIVSQSFLGIDSKPTSRNDSGISTITFSYDQRGNTISTSNFGVDGKPIADLQSAAAQIRDQYDDRGNWIERAWFGTDNRLTVTGQARVKSVYDRQSRRIAIIAIDADGNRTRFLQYAAFDFAEFRFAYDNKGNLVASSFYGTDGKPVAVDGVSPFSAGTESDHYDGVSSMRATYDSRGNETSESYYRVNGRSLASIDGVARVSRQYDAVGNGISEAYFDSAGQPVLSNNGCARIEATYDEMRNQTMFSCFGTDGRLALLKAGYARETDRYDQRGVRIAVSYFDTAGKPIHMSGKESATKRVLDYLFPTTPTKE